MVARGPGHKRDLRIVRPYIRDFKPVLVGVDGGADALLEAGYRPRRDRRRHGLGLRRRARVRRRARRPRLRATAQAPGAARLERLGVPYHAVPAPGISEDVALLLAYEKGAELIVAVGTHFNLVEFLERNRAGMSSTFMTRLRVGEILVDAKGVSRLVSRRVGVWPLVAFALAGLGGDRRRDRGVAAPPQRDRAARATASGGALGALRVATGAERGTRAARAARRRLGVPRRAASPAPTGGRARRRASPTAAARAPARAGVSRAAEPGWLREADAGRHARRPCRRA